MKKIITTLLFLATFSVLLVNCNKEEVILPTENIISVPTINQSKNSFLSSTEGIRTKSSNDILSKIDWNNSYPTNFKENIDILYTPLKYNSNLAKTFLASVKIKGEVQYRYMTLIYDKGKNNRQSFSGHILTYGKKGKLLNVFTYEDGDLKESKQAKKTTTKGGGGIGCTLEDIIAIVNDFGLGAIEEDYFSCVDLSSQGMEENGDGGNVDNWSIPGINISTPGPTNPGENGSANNWWSEPDNCPVGQTKDANGNCVVETIWTAETVLFPNVGPGIIDISDYIKCFNETQGATLTIYVDQPKTNSSDTWAKDNQGNVDVGHTFISISQNGITRTLGLYPDGGIKPKVQNNANGILVNDSEHPYDVSASRDITAGQLSSLLLSIESYGIDYNLEHNNCSDFGLFMVNQRGFNLPDTSGIWPGGSGTNPGNLGQDVRLDNTSGTTVNSTGGNAPKNSGSCP